MHTQLYLSFHLQTLFYLSFNQICGLMKLHNIHSIILEVQNADNFMFIIQPFNKIKKNHEIKIFKKNQEIVENYFIEKLIYSELFATFSNLIFPFKCVL